MLNIENITVRIGNVEVLRDVSMSVPTGMICGLLGRNGAGKTTVIRTVMGLLKPTIGRIMIDGIDVTRKAARCRADLGVGYMPEDRRLIPTLSVRENILLPAWGTHIADGTAQLELICDRIPELSALLERAPMELSGGQQKLVALARAMMAGRKLLILDEPTEGVAPVLARRIEEVLNAMKGSGLSVLVADSNMNDSNGRFEHSHFIERGQIVTRAVEESARDIT